jgi:hypothetical protein
MKKVRLLTALVGMVLMIAAIPIVSAANLCVLYDTGDAESYEFRFVVLDPDYLSLDSATNWVINTTVSPFSDSVTNATFYLLISINDGVSNITSNKTVAAKNDKSIYPENEFYPGDFVANGSAKVTVKVLNTTFVEKDCSVCIVPITATEYSGLINSMIPVIVTVAVIGMVVTMMKGIDFGGRRTSGKRKKK